MSHEEAERVLRRRLPLRPDDDGDVCGSLSTTTRLANRDVDIQWSDDPRHEIQMIYVTLKNRDIGELTAGIGSALGAAATKCETDFLSDSRPCFVHQARVMVDVEDEGPAPALRIVMEDCVD